MELTDKHVSDERLNALIASYENLYGGKPPDFVQDVLSTFLELKQRRAEDRAKTACK